MSGMRWTPAQRAAIEDRGGTLLVSAAAGSGKTAGLGGRAGRPILGERAPPPAGPPPRPPLPPPPPQGPRARLPSGRTGC